MPANTYALTEPVIRAILARLEDPAQLNAEIASIAAGVTVADQAASLVPIPLTNINDFIPPPSFLVDFPQIGLADLSSRLEDDTGHSVTGRHVIGVTIFCSDPNPEILAWELRRYAQAVIRVILAGRSIPELTDAGGRAAAWGTGLDSIAWGPTLASKASPTVWMSWCMAAIWARREEL